jgi:hypothetical protein
MLVKVHLSFSFPAFFIISGESISSLNTNIEEKKYDDSQHYAKGGCFLQAGT